MLRIYAVVLELIAALVGIVEEIEKRDVRLARQMRDAMSSIALNVAEGAGNTGGHKRQRYQTALGSAQEVNACLDVARAMRYIGDVDAGIVNRMNHVIGTLVRLVRR